MNVNDQTLVFNTSNTQGISDSDLEAMNELYQELLETIEQDEYDEYDERELEEIEYEILDLVDAC